MRTTAFAGPRRCAAAVLASVFVVLGLQLIGATVARAHPGSTGRPAACPVGGSEPVGWSVHAAAATRTKLHAGAATIPAGVAPGAEKLSAGGTAAADEPGVANLSRTCAPSEASSPDPVTARGSCTPGRPGCVSATPVSPTFVDDVCVDHRPAGPSYTIASTGGVSYLVHGVVQPAGTHPGTDDSSLTVTTQPQPGYYLSGTTRFTHTFPATPVCLITRRAAAPTFSPAECIGGTTGRTTTPTYTVPITGGVQYLVHGAVVAAGSYPATPATVVTVVARPLPGYRLTDTTTWSHRYPASTVCTVAAKPAAPRFTEDRCVSGVPAGATVTVPAVHGVGYRIDGLHTAAGSHSRPDSSTVRVTAVPAPGYRLLGRTVWAHTFGARPAGCRATGGRSGHGPSAGRARQLPVTSPPVPGLSDTGAPVQTTLITGIAVLLTGLASHIGASTRQRRRPTGPERTPGP